jgi:hypothetical protein
MAQHRGDAFEAYVGAQHLASSRVPAIPMSE